MIDWLQVAANIVEDLSSSATNEKPGRAGMGALASSTSWSDWKMLDSLEEQEGQKTGKLRNCLIDRSERSPKTTVRIHIFPFSLLPILFGNNIKYVIKPLDPDLYQISTISLHMFPYI